VKLLLDTHTFLWWLSVPHQLSTPASAAIADPANEVHVSVITLWEIAIKRAIGKLQAPIDLQSDVTRAVFNSCR
jgi:PIN domain nuclease of toxin-antitoxin system